MKNFIWRLEASIKLKSRHHFRNCDDSSFSTQQSNDEDTEVTTTLVEDLLQKLENVFVINFFKNFFNLTNFDGSCHAMDVFLKNLPWP